MEERGARTPRPCESPMECRRVSLKDIVLDDFTYQMRVETRVGDLKQSLQDDGQLEPVHLVGASPPFRIVDGFRRCTAAKALGWEDVQAFVHEALAEEHAFKLAFLHNVVRKNLRPIDRANAIRLAQKRGMKLHEAAAELNLSEKQARRYLSLLRLPRDVQDAIDTQDFTMAHALVVAEFEVGNVELVVAEVKAKKITAVQLRKKLRNVFRRGAKNGAARQRFVTREGNAFRFYGGLFSLDAPREDRERLAGQLLDVVALLQRGVRAASRPSMAKEKSEGCVEMEAS